MLDKVEEAERKKEEEEVRWARASLPGRLRPLGSGLLAAQGPLRVCCCWGQQQGKAGQLAGACALFPAAPLCRPAASVPATDLWPWVTVE